MSLADRGKKTEKAVQDYFEVLNKSLLGFVFERTPDARAARGAFKAMMSDFRVDCQRVDGQRASFAIEAKETQHAFRLAKDKLPQLMKLRKARHAGIEGIVVVFHSTQKVWRCIPLSFFDGEVPASWDLSSWPTHSCVEDALLTHWVWHEIVYNGGKLPLVHQPAVRKTKKGTTDA